MRRFRSIVWLAAAVLLLVAGVLSAWLGPELRYVVFAHPWVAWTAAVPLLAALFGALRDARPAALTFSRAWTVRRLPREPLAELVHLPDGLRLAGAILLAVALARPQSTRSSERLRHEGIDIVVALDLSDSMEADDLPPNRLVAATQVIDAFIARRPRDRIGLVAFGAHASTISPLTSDHGVLRALVKRLRLGIVDGQKTAIGAGLGVALNRLEDSTAKSKVIVLLTDGVHNADGLDPDAAAQKAAEREIKVYTVLIGQHEQGLGVKSIDPGRLERIASVTGGYAYTAADPRTLVTSFQDLLNRLERSEIEGEEVRGELFGVLLWPAVVLLFLDLLLRHTWLRRFP